MLNLKSKPITREKVNHEMTKSNEIGKIAGTVMRATFLLTGNTDGQAYYNKEYNAFIFDRSSILKYFYGTNIPELPTGSAECLVVITAAHDIDEEGFKTGERTAIVCGMMEKKDSAGKPILDNEHNTVLQVVDPGFVLGNQGASAPNAPVADQYPPRRIWTELPLLEDLKIVVEKI